MNTWLDQVASQLLQVEADLRRELRERSAGRPSARFHFLGYNSVALSIYEARALLRGAMPVPVITAGLRQPHARMLTALAVFSRDLVALNDRLKSLDESIAAAAGLLRELEAWRQHADWLRATRAARVRWRPAHLAISNVIGLQRPEHAGNIASLPDAPLRLVRQLAARDLAAERQLDLPLPAPVVPIDPRQLRLQLVA